MSQNSNMRLWDAVSKTNPAHTKKVNQRGGFTAISAHYQIMRATETFGPIGEGWGYDVADPIWHDALVFVPVTIWHGNREQTFGPIFGGAEWRSDKGRLDSDAPKKATTDGLTKALSQLGFNADVFLGRFDDNKYVERMAQEFTPPPETASDKPVKVSLKGPIKTRAALRVACGEFVKELHACADEDQLEAFLVTPESKALTEQVEAEHQLFWEGDGNDFRGLRGEIMDAWERVKSDSVHNIRDVDGNPVPITAAG